MTDEASGEPSGIDTTVPHSARIWNYWLGGRDNYEVDRVAGDRLAETSPDVVRVARASRAFTARSVGYLARTAGVRQFLDIGAGLPTAENTHETAQRIEPTARVLYVDKDPLVIAHARARLVSGPKGSADYLRADLRDPGRILDEAARTMDLSRPVALILSNVLGHVGDYRQARSIVRRLMAGLPPGSHLSLNDGTGVVRPESRRAARQYAATGAVPYHLRTPRQIAGFFDGLELVPPGVVSCPRWNPDPPPDGEPARELDVFGGVGRKS
ncbi:SAM-dependent methyltransferase [Streptomyces sp. 6N223]|uniref:SAM-dependent methyltransferase n=1 Tax=Streptomyces sp. 6N223 TaxID=3457412 RepID=UPI003FD15F00